MGAAEFDVYERMWLGAAQISAEAAAGTPRPHRHEIATCMGVAGLEQRNLNLNLNPNLLEETRSSAHSKHFTLKFKHCQLQGF